MSMNRERLKLESEVTQEEATMRLKQSEIKSMSNETETLHQMVRQLDNQKTEARKRLDDLGAQVKFCLIFHVVSCSKLTG